MSCELGFDIRLRRSAASTARASCDAALRDQPARAARNRRTASRKNSAAGSRRRRASSAIRCRRMPHGADQVIRKVGEQNARDDVELKEADQAAAPFRRRDFRDVHGAEHRRAADAQAADKAEEHQRIPVPGKRAAERGNEIQHAMTRRLSRRPMRSPGMPASMAPRIVPARALATVSRDLPAHSARCASGVGGARDNRCIEAEQQAAQGGHDGASDEK